MLTRDEKQKAEAEFEAELAAEHARRQEAVQRRKERRGGRRSSHDEDQRRIELYELREAVRERFYKDNGYKKYIDSTGREVWLSPEEYTQRMRRRKRRARSGGAEPQLGNTARQFMLYGGLALLAIVLGFALAR